MKINFNMSAVISNDCLNKTDNALSNSIEKLSSGYKINHAKDSPSGIAISKRMNAQIRGLSTATQNASDGVSVIEIAEGALTEVHEMLQRLNELSIKGANGPMSDSDRESLQEEVDALLEEIDRIASATEFNGSTLLDGTYDIKGYAERSQKDLTFDTSAVKVEYYSDEAKAGLYEVEIETDIDLEGEIFVSSAKINDPAAGAAATLAFHGKTVDQQTVSNQKTKLDEDKHTITIEGDNSFVLTLDIDFDKFRDKATQADPNPALRIPGKCIINLNLTGIGAMTTQIGSNEGQTLDIRIPTVSTKTLGVKDLDVSTEEESTDSIDKISDAIAKVSAVRSRLGAYQNRLEHTISSLDITSENMTAAYSRIVDVDMAEEMTEYTKDQVLSQAGTSMLAQANERPSQILQLLQ